MEPRFRHRPIEAASGATRAAGRALAGLALLVAACGGPDAPSSSGWSVRDSAGVRVATSTRPAQEGPEAWRLADTLLTIGGEEDADLFGVSGGVLLPEGGVALAVDGTAQVRFYGSDGSLRGAYGGRGDGPGEFRILAGVGRAGGDTVWAYDYGSARASLLTPAGGFVGSVALRPPLPAGTMVGRRSDGAWVVGQLWGSSPAGDAEAEGLVRERSVYARYAPDGTLADTLGLFPGREVLQRMEGRRMTMGVAPFARSASHALLGDDLVVGDQVGYELSVIGPRSTLLVRWSGPPLDVTRRDVDAWTEGRVAEAEAPERAAVRAWLADVPFPERRPAYGAVLVDPDGFLWVGAYAGPGDEAARWERFDASGRWLGTLVMPERFRLLDVAGDRVLGVTRDAFDVERVEVRRLPPPAR